MYSFEGYIALRSDLRKNWNSPIKARIHWIFFGLFERGIAKPYPINFFPVIIRNFFMIFPLPFRYFLLKNLFKKCVRTMSKLTHRIKDRKDVHFLHIPKTGGTAVRHILGKKARTEKYYIYFRLHGVRLIDIDKGDKIIFAVRDPINRFVSGFCARKREVQLRDVEENDCFKMFKSPKQLAKSLSDKDPEIRSIAIRAMKTIIHVNSSYMDWFENKEYFLSRKADVLFILRQENLNEDFKKLKNILALPDNSNLPDDDRKANRDPFKVDKHLDPEAIENLKKWYAKDYDFLEFLKENNFLGNKSK